MEYVRYNPTDEFYKSIVGAVSENVRFGVCVQLNQVVNPTSVKMVVFSDDHLQNYEYTMYKAASGDGYDSYRADVSFKKGLYFSSTCACSSRQTEIPASSMPLLTP